MLPESIREWVTRLKKWCLLSGEASLGLSSSGSLAGRAKERARDPTRASKLGLKLEKGTKNKE